MLVRQTKYNVPSCVLRINVATEPVLAAMLEWIPFKPLAVFRKGVPRTPGSTHLSRSNGFNVLVSDHDGTDIALQISDAQRFLAVHRDALLRISSVSGLEGMCLDFGSEIPHDAPMRTHEFPFTLLCACAECSISLHVSVYLTDESDPTSDDPKLAN